MDGEDWDIQEIKRLKKRLLVQNNLLMLVLLVLFATYVKNGGSANVLLGICCAFFWIFAAGMLYTFKTGKIIGTKSSQRVHAFDKDQVSEKRWKRKATKSVVFLIGLSVVFTLFWFLLDFDSVGLQFTVDALPFIVCWIGFNIGETVRIRKL